MDINKILEVSLTEDQRRAVLDNSRNILCLACAGSGKSRTLAYKIAYLISQGASPDSIIAFTFTEKAAASIKRRVAEALNKFGFPENYIGVMFIGTIDSFCQKLLGDVNAKYRQYDILDQNGLILFVMSRLKKLGIDPRQGVFQRMKNIVQAWETMNNENIDIERIKEYDNDLYMILHSLRDNMLKDGYMDFSFAIRLAVDEIRNIRKKKASSIEKYEYVFVDEYQDINPVQEEFIKTLSSYMKMLFVVGDDDQSIYGWRGANVQNILTFENRYEGVAEHRLFINFRSTSAIVETASSFIQRQLPYERLPKDVRAFADGNIQDIRNLWFETAEEEAEWIADRIKSLVGTTLIEYDSNGKEKSRRGLSYSDFAILLRSIHNSRGENHDVRFVNALKKRGIPVKTTGEGGIFDRPYAQTVLSLMDLLRDKNSGREQFEKLYKNTIKDVFPLSDKEKIVSVLQRWYREIHAPIQAGSRRKVYPQKLLFDLLDALDIRSMNDEIALRDMGLFSKIILDVEKTYVSIDASYRYKEMLNYFQNIAQYSYELEPLDYLSMDDAVNISTIHKVKGLEFPVVFVADLVDKRFPHVRAEYNGLIPDALMENARNRGAYGTRQEDEARLFYTAITRAERVLYLSGSAFHPGLKKDKRRSRFIAELNHSKMRTDKKYDELAAKMESIPRFDDEVFPTDYSSVKSYLTCPFSYKLSSLYGYNAAVPEMFGYGKTSHTTLERLHQVFKEMAPSEDEVKKMVDDTFLLKHIFPSNDPINSPGPYERAKDRLKDILIGYVKKYKKDFGRLRQDEARFEISAEGALITGAIDLLLQEDAKHGITSADVIDFKTMELPDNTSEYDWRDMSIQVQLYSKAAKEVLGENVETGYIHTLKDNKRTEIPVDEKSVEHAIAAIEWAVHGILENDFPMRPCEKNCSNCDFKALCKQQRQEFKTDRFRPTIMTPNGERIIAAFDLGDERDEKNKSN